MKYQYATNCVSAIGEDIDVMIDHAIDVTYPTVEKAVGRDQLKELFPQYEWHGGHHGLLMRNDWAVSYHRSRYLGKRCYFIRHSGIEYVFVES